MYIKSIIVVSPNDNKYLAIATCINKYIFIILPITKKYIYIYINARFFFFFKIPKPTRSTSVQLHPKPHKPYQIRLTHTHKTKQNKKTKQILLHITKKKKKKEKLRERIKRIIKPEYANCIYRIDKKIVRNDANTKKEITNSRERLEIEQAQIIHSIQISVDLDTDENVPAFVFLAFFYYQYY